MTFKLHQTAAFGAAIRSATTTDQAFLATLYRTTREDEMTAAGMPQSARPLFALQQFAAQQRDYALRFPALDRFIVVMNARPVGRLDLNISSEDFRLVDISLLPDVRGGGLGTAILRDVMAHAASLARGVCLSVRDDNRAQQLYRRLGFRAGERRAGYIAMAWRPPPPG